MELYPGMSIVLLTFCVVSIHASDRDFNAPLVPAPRPADSSAATIGANALLLLAKSEQCPAAAKRWSDAAIQVNTRYIL